MTNALSWSLLIGASPEAGIASVVPPRLSVAGAEVTAAFPIRSDLGRLPVVSPRPASCSERSPHRAPDGLRRGQRHARTWPGSDVAAAVLVIEEAGHGAASTSKNPS